MLGCLYSRRRTEYTHSPVSDWLEAFALWAEASGYSPPLIRGHVYRLKLSLEKDPLGPMGGTVKVSKARLQKIFFTDKKARKQLFLATHHLFKRFLDDHDYFLPEEPEAFFKLIEEYCTFLRELRGYAPDTVHRHRSTVSRFLSHVLLPEENLTLLTSEAITRFVRQESTRQGRYALRHTVA